MTLTTEQLRAIAEEELDACATLDAAKLMARELLANREAQPVALVDRRPAASGSICWQNGGKDLAHGTELFTAPPAPEYPERLPCPVHLLPGLKFGKGVPTRSMLDALVRRAEYESERDAMTPEQKAEDDARIEAFKALLPPAPAVPDEISSAIRHLKDTLVACNRFNYCADAVQRVENACRAAMLAQPVSGGYTLNSPEIPDGWIACSEQMPELDKRVLLYFDSYDGHIEDGCIGDDGDGPYHYFFDGDSLQQEPTHWMPLPAAPEGGNDHDTRR